MSSVVISGDTSGAITLSAPAVSGTNTATLPAATGTVMVSGNMPAFSAYQSASQTPSAATFTKCQFQAEEFDTANAFDSTTNYRFTPQVAGYYQVNAAASFGGAANVKQIAIYKNGSTYKQGSDAAQTECTVSCLVYLNGSTDYIELYIYTVTSVVTDALSNRTYFQASMVRAA